jgi:hypothetical protein
VQALIQKKSAFIFGRGTRRCPPRAPGKWLGFFRFDYNGEPAGIVSQVTFVETRIAILGPVAVVTFGVFTAVGAPCVGPRIVLDQSVAVWVLAKPHFFLASLRAASNRQRQPLGIARAIF